jgi:hypothetical protein
MVDARTVVAKHRKTAQDALTSAYTSSKFVEDLSGTALMRQTEHRSPGTAAKMARQLIFVALLLLSTLCMSTAAPAAGDSCSVAEVSMESEQRSVDNTLP